MTGTSMADQLAPLRRTMGPSVYEVLAVQADLHGADPAGAVDAARRETLRWMAQRDRVGKLPEVAWRLETFEHLPPGNKAWAVRFEKDGLDWWAARCEIVTQGREDGIVRVWTTEVSIVGQHARGRLTIRQSVATHEPHPAIAPTVPGIARQLADAPGLIVDGRALSEAPWIVGPDEAGTLIDLVEKLDRRLPVVVVSLGEEVHDPSTAAIDASDLARKALGLAHVAVVAGPATYTLTDHWSKDWSCFLRAVRVYWPGFDRYEQAREEHPLFLPHVIERWPERHGLPFTEQVQRELGTASLRRLRSDQEIPRFTTIRQAALEAERTAAGQTLTVRLAAADEQITELERERDQSLQWEQEAKDEARRATERAQQAEAAYAALLSRYQLLERAPPPVVGGGMPPPSWPESLDDLARWCADEHAGHLILTPRAARAAKKADFEGTALVYEAIDLLVREYRTWRMEGEARRAAYEGRLRRLRLQNDRCGDDVRLHPDRFGIDYEGGRRMLDMHLKNGGNTRDPKRCFRLYYFWDDDKQLCVVGSLPGHLRTGAT